MEIKKYKKTSDKVSFTVFVEEMSVDVILELTSHCSVSMTDTDDFLIEVEERFGSRYADMIEEFISFQSSLLMSKIPFMIEMDKEKE